ncbi:hypothetical protein BYT27DRAFT_7204413 [Phlegmacium glaucopus]|nr:hypothetical protein BYT27DRAFT_7204413 [Phlegmacium glaucopus]
MKTVDSPTHTPITKPNAPLINIKRKWLLGILLFGILAKLPFNYITSNLESYVLCSETNNIYTVDESRPRVECISVRGSYVIDSGKLAEIIGSHHNYLAPLDGILPAWIIKLTNRPSRVIHIDPQAIVVPGLADAHAHIVENGLMMDLPLAGSESIQDVVERVKAYILSHPDVQNDMTQWIVGWGWDQTKWSITEFPKAADLDQDPLLKGRLICLSRVDGHSRWVSPAVLQQMPDLPDKVDGGLVVRDEQGNPTGIFIDNAMNLVPIPEWSEETMSRYFELTMKEALSYGLTSIHDADSKVGMIKVFKRMAETGKLANRLYLMGNIPSNEYWGNQLPRLINYGKHGRLNLRSVKLFADGALGSWGAALLAPYSDKPDEHGLMLSSPEILESLVQQFWKDGWQTAIHCIGDRANQVILDIYEGILTRSGGNVTEWRPRIEHAQIFAPSDLKRIGDLGVIASVQPTHATSDMWYAEGRIGSERIKSAYAYQTLLSVSPKHILPLGSDFPVEGVNPLLGFYAAVSRLSVYGTSPHGSGGWYLNEGLSRTQALKGMTLDAAYASFAENEIGSLSPGKKADFVIFDKDIMTIPLHQILETKVKATVVDGKAAYGTF